MKIVHLSLIMSKLHFKFKVRSFPHSSLLNSLPPLQPPNFYWPLEVPVTERSGNQYQIFV